MNEEEQAASVRVSDLALDLAQFQAEQVRHQEFVADKLQVINREVGELIGEVRAIKWMMGGGLLLAVLLRFLV